MRELFVEQLSREYRTTASGGYHGQHFTAFSEGRARGRVWLHTQVRACALEWILQFKPSRCGPLARRSSEGPYSSFLLSDGRIYARGRSRIRHEGGGNDQHRGTRQRRGSTGMVTNEVVC